MTDDDLHIYWWAEPGQRRHEHARDCWCDPDIVEPERKTIAGLVIVAHTGLPQPSVARSLEPPFDLFPGELGEGLLRVSRPR